MTSHAAATAGGLFFCSGAEAQPKRRANDFGLAGVVLRSGLLHGSSHLWLDIAEQSNRAFALRSECCFRHWIRSQIRYGAFLADRQIYCNHWDLGRGLIVLCELDSEPAAGM